MKLIHKFKSPNFNERKSNKIQFIIIHYTAIKSISESIKYLCEKKNKVSAHYIISKKGKIYSLVSEKKRAWHAGQSYWNGIIDMNSNSIGIELDYLPEKEDTKYSKELINSLIELIKKLKKKHAVASENILGHSDIAPYRKIDPGKNFPWHLLENKNFAFKITKLKINTKTLFNKWLVKNKFFSNNKKILFMLDYIGYDISLALINKSKFNQLIMIYSDRFRCYNRHTIIRKNIFQLIELHFLNILLTKSKK